MNPIWTHAVIGRKKQGVPWWLAGDAPAPLAAYQAIGAESQAASYINLANPGVYTITPTVAPSWNSTDGWVFSGSQYMNTNCIISPFTTKSVLCRFAYAAPLSDGAVVGVRHSTATTAMLGVIPNSSFYGGSKSAWLGRSPTYYAPAMTEGVLGLSGRNGFVNGLSVGKTSNSYTGANTRPTYIGCIMATDPLPNTYFIGNIQAVALYDYELTADQVAAVSAAMAAL